MTKPEVLVMLRVHNPGRAVLTAVASVLQQTGVDVRLVVVDDRSTDGSPELLAAWQTRDSRFGAVPTGSVIVLVETSSTRWVAQVEADDVLLPDALATLVGAAGDDAGLVVCTCLELDVRGRVLRVATRRRLQQHRDSDPHILLQRFPHTLGGVRVYRRDALLAVGGFGPLANQLPVVLVRRALCARRRASKTMFQALKSWFQGLPQRLTSPLRWGRQLVRKVQWRVRQQLYPTAVRWFSRYTLPPAPRHRLARRHVAYYTWHFPVLSQTFIHRELAALRRAGVVVDILAEGAEDLEHADANARQMLDRVKYTEPWETDRLLRYQRHFLGHCPVSCLQIMAFIVGRHYAASKNWYSDKRTFRKVIYLAGLLKESGADHVHSPWADSSAFEALLAARLLGISYSVQARAHDVHRKTYQVALRDKLQHADFVVTNTHYNLQFLRDLLPAKVGTRLNLIYNGLDLERFVPGPREPAVGRPFKLLCVARLIEPKGLVYLLHACKIMLEQGCDFRCDIVGGPELPLYTNYYLALKRLHRRLSLERHVRFVGSLPFEDVLTYYRTADMFVLPCVVAEDGTQDITPNALIEAMAMQLPVISTPQTGIPEIVEDGVSGILVPSNSETALASAIMKLIPAADERRRLGENARRRVRSRFDVDRNVSQYVALFRSTQPSTPPVGVGNTPREERGQWLPGSSRSQPYR